MTEPTLNPILEPRQNPPPGPTHSPVDTRGRVAGRLVVELSGVSRTYPGSPPVEALREVGLSVRRGELLAIVGPSGSGKSTLLHVVGTLDRPDAGTVRVAGYDVAGLSDRQLSALRALRVGFVFQHFFLAPGLSALDNVADGLLYTGAGRAERRRRAGETLNRVGLGRRLAHRPHELSGGEQQRVAIARAVVGDPPLLLADEPTGNLDSRSGVELVTLLGELNAAGTTVIVITHDRELSRRFPRVVQMRDGQVITDSGALAVAGSESASGAGSGAGS